MTGPVDSEGDDLGHQKREAMRLVFEAWEEASGAGVEPEVLAHVSLFAALRNLVEIYGEDATAEFAARLSERILDGEFTAPILLN
ncbi:hypothetical protein [Propylenella binzhouense]|uniref:Uncharacterized protein n=1 Tax=Propylenella binzhouense TaxID=2555902 RepID=A0A964WTL5_9HYPH|nr:hypothetical protein [Propylenella binzhouense]MYZ48157.1 hypothetical protein [Propylenella binzhouense]